MAAATSDLYTRQPSLRRTSSLIRRLVKVEGGDEPSVAAADSGIGRSARVSGQPE